MSNNLGTFIDVHQSLEQIRHQIELQVFYLNESIDCNQYMSLAVMDLTDSLSTLRRRTLKECP